MVGVMHIVAGLVGLKSGSVEMSLVLNAFLKGLRGAEPSKKTDKETGGGEEETKHDKKLAKLV